jgi:hypothetical protein
MKLSLSLMAVCIGLSLSPMVFAKEDPKFVMKAYFDDLNTGNFKHLGELLSDGIIWHQPSHRQ